MQKLKDKFSDEELVKRSQQGDSKATDELFARYSNFVRVRARQFFLAGGETDDLVQEGMIGLYKAMRDYCDDYGKSFKNFAYMCVSRRIYDAISAQTNRKNLVLHSTISLYDPNLLSVIDGKASPEDFIIDDEARNEFYLKLSRVLSDFEYRVVTLYLNGMSYTDISEVTGKSYKSIDNALARSKKKLQTAFEK